MKKEVSADNSFGVASVILGILSIISTSFPGIIMGVIGLVFSIKQKKISGNKWSKIGFILNIIGIVIGIITVVFFISYIGNVAQFQGGF